MQLLTVSAIGSEWYHDVFHRTVLHRPPVMHLSTYAAYGATFVFLTTLSMLSSPGARLSETPKSK